MFTWDLTHFLDSIRAPFLSFNESVNETIKFIYSINAKLNTSHLSFPFPMPDLYLDRPLVLKFYIESPSQLKQLIFNGSYLKKTNAQSFNIVQEFAYAHVSGNDVIDNDEFPLESLLANEELDYWHGDYWFKHQNWLARQTRASVAADSSESSNPFLLFGSVDREHAARIISDLSDQTGIPSIFRTLVSFVMTPKKYQEFENDMKVEREQSKTQLSRISESITITNTNTNANGASEEKQNVLLGQLWHAQGNNAAYNTLNVNNGSNQADPSSSMGSNNNGSRQAVLSVSNASSNNNNTQPTTKELARIKKGMNKRGVKNEKSKLQAVTSVAILGVIGVAALINPFSGDGGGNDDDFFGINFAGGGSGGGGGNIFTKIFGCCICGKASGDSFNDSECCGCDDCCEDCCCTIM